ncbi:MAG: hypothetical protein HWN68_10910 [Desulfobacterales bacterium]|nr:hypothetical protein [Desulfobacterales bacterium]
MKLEDIERDMYQLEDRVQHGLATGKVVVWLVAIVGALIRCLVQKEG